ncbi:MAG: periplasmic heavy metal sensor [Desulfobacter sp.]|nr:MAG: periplasmic heavy metal sensor [Desulfobacter sp.]
MKKSLITLTALLIVGLMASSAFAWGHGQGRRGGCGGEGRAVYNNLTPEQQTQLRELRQQFVDETYETRSAMMTKHQELRMLMETSSPDKAKLQGLSDEILGLKKVLADKRIDFSLKAKDIAPELNFMAFGGRHHGRGGFGGKGDGNRRGGDGPCNWGADCPKAVQ